MRRSIFALSILAAAAWAADLALAGKQQSQAPYVQQILPAQQAQQISQWPGQQTQTPRPNQARVHIQQLAPLPWLVQQAQIRPTQAHPNSSGAQNRQQAHARGFRMAW